MDDQGPAGTTIIVSNPISLAVPVNLFVVRTSHVYS
jgi:hypothetical protein